MNKYISTFEIGESEYKLKDSEVRTDLGTHEGNTDIHVTAAEKEYWNSKVNPPYCSIPTAKSLTYTGEAQDLLNPGSSTSGTIQYSTDETNWSTIVPQGTNAGTYTIYWRFIGSEVIYIDSTSIDVSIAKASRTMTWITNPNEAIVTTSKTIEASSTGDGLVVYSSSDTTKATINGNTVNCVDVGTTTITASVSETTNYLSASIGYTLSVIDAIVNTVYNITDLSYPTEIINSNNKNGFKFIEIDGIAFPPGLKKYQFSSTGEHIVKYTLHDATKLDTNAFRGCKDIISLTIPDSVTVIDSGALSYCYGLTGITIPDGVTTIGENAFYYCTNLTSVNIPNSVTRICRFAFDYCTSLPVVDYVRYADTCACGVSDRTRSSYTLKNDVKFLSSTFSSCSNLTSITIPNSVVLIGLNTFNSCTSLTSITIPNSVTYIDDQAFNGCTQLASINIPSSVTSIGDYVFAYCTSLPVINHVRYADTCACGVDDKNLSSYTLRSGTRFLDNTFGSCKSLTSITIPDSVVLIGQNSFSGCISLTNINIPNSVTKIGDNAFGNCTGLTSIYIPDNVISINPTLFYGCTNINTITVSNNNVFYDSRDNCNAIIHTPSNTLISGCDATLIPNSVTSIGDYAFSGCTGLTSIIIPNNVTSIGKNAFRSSGLTSITIPDSVTTISGSFASFCGSLTNVTLGNYTTYIGESAFWGCTNLTSINIPNSVAYIGTYAFYSCSNLTSITIPNGIGSIEERTFESCTNLTSVNIPNSVTNIGKNAFRGCTGLTNCIIGSGVTTIEDYAFLGCSNLSSITIPDNVTYIGFSAFEYSISAATIEATIPPTLMYNGLGDSGYWGTLKAIYVPSESVDAYKSATNWSNYSSIIQAIS